MVPVAGSAYTYAYATMGELFAWIIGWDLVLEYTVCSSTVAHGWSAHFRDLLASFGVHIPPALANAPFDFNPATGQFVATGSIVDVPAIAITAIITVVLVIGIRESAGFNAIMVGVKLAIVLFVIVVGAFYIDPANWQPFAPYGFSGISFFGHTLFGQTAAGGEPLGVLAGAAIIFFAYIGFDSVSTHAEEARQPQRDVPIGIIASLLVCTVLYIAVSAVLTGMVRYDRIDINAPVANAFAQQGLPWAQRLIDVGAITGITSVLLVMMLSQPRVLLAMARDGLVPTSFFGAVHEKFRTPWKATLLTGLCVATMAALLPLRILAELSNIGTLLAFVIVCTAVLIMRRTHPEAERPFKAPLFPWVPIAGIVTCLILMFSLPAENWTRLLVWLALGFVIYFGYGRKRSVLARLRAQKQGAHLNS
jgi:APA family basic amino acid/polyamine antiporter